MTTSRAIRTCALGVTTALVFLAAGCGDDDDDAATTPDPPAETAETVTGTLVAANQSGDGTSLVVKKVTINNSTGWIALHKDAKGAPGAVVGFVEIAEGESTKVKVKGEKKLVTGAYWPMLHTDDGTIGTYEFGESEGAKDAPVMADGKPVMKKVKYTRK